MSNSYASSLPRSINFKETNMRDFVMGSSFTKANQPSRGPNMHPLPLATHIHQSPFDSYHRSHLLLTACSPEDIQLVQKNPVVFQEDLLLNSR